VIVLRNRSRTRMADMDSIDVQLSIKEVGIVRLGLGMVLEAMHKTDGPQQEYNEVMEMDRVLSDQLHR
jgi:hypothetical protein